MSSEKCLLTHFWMKGLARWMKTPGNGIETLAGLPQDGKLIGVISHIPALKERIAAHISIEPIAGGRSIITGPGDVLLFLSISLNQDDIVDVSVAVDFELKSHHS